ncbi:MAG: hypothetical protein QNJ46_05840 [Leptolyngbyaceae cyanobacterium MO_188.B28]|nr:hypothetical protein [Leptolyngbyaceae cyanobacterium MO_188.B28]
MGSPKKGKATASFMVGEPINAPLPKSARDLEKVVPLPLGKDRATGRDMPDPMFVTLAEIVDYTGISRHVVNYMLGRGQISPEINADGKYDFFEFNRQIHIFRAEQKQENATTLNDAKVRLANAQAEKVELENAKSKGDLIPLEQHKAAMNEAAIAFNDVFEKLAAELPSELANTPDEERSILPVVVKWANKMRRKLAERFAA